jgi:hypothetical protein
MKVRWALDAAGSVHFVKKFMEAQVKALLGEKN